MTRTHAASRRAKGEFTFTETARREQIICLTIDLLAENGFSRTTLAQIAKAAGLSNAAVIYFFNTKNAVLQAAAERVMSETIDAISTAVSEAPSARTAIDAYVRSVVTHMATHPSHMRVMIEMLTSAPPEFLEAVTGTQAAAASRWHPVAELIDAAISEGDIRPLASRTAAIALIGATDAIFAESLADPEYDLAKAVDDLLELFDRSTTVNPESSR